MKNYRSILLIIFIFLLSGFLGLLFSLYMHRSAGTSQLSDVQITQTVHYPSRFVDQIKNDPQAGKKIFKEFCASCHASNPNIDVNAPRIGDKKAWKELRKKSEKQLLDLTISGKGAMPARGGCFECSDEQLKQAIRYMTLPK